MDQDGPVTVVVRHRVKPGKEADFEEWLQGISRAAVEHEGSLGLNVIRPTDGHGRREYVVLVRFDTLANLEKWDESEARRQWMEKLSPLTALPPTRVRHTGLEVWFTPPAGRPQPPRYKMAMVVLLALYPLILLAQITLSPLLSDWPIMLRTLVTSTVMVCVMTYAAIPIMTHLLSRWLYGQRE